MVAQPAEEENPDRSRSGVTARSLTVGALGSLLISLIDPYGNMLHRWYLATDFSTEAAVFVFFVFAGLGNALLGLVHRRAALRRDELAVVYIMLIVASSIPSMGFSETLLPLIIGVYYYATPENNWVESIQPYVPEWIAPHDPHAIKAFYEGLPEGGVIPWEVWLAPLFHWCLFILVVYFVMICMMVVLRKQWVERERLVYPLVQAPLEMIRDDEDGDHVVRPFFRSPYMWLGFVIPFTVLSLNSVSLYYPYIPGIQLSTSLGIFRNTIQFPISLNFSLMGFSYFIGRDIAFGVWFFYLLTVTQQGLLNLVGYSSSEQLSVFGNPQYPYLAHEGMGAIIVYVLLGFWIARGHLGDVLRKAFGRAPDVVDSAEMLPYRTAVFGIIGGFLYIGFWLHASGLPAVLVPAFLFAAFLIFLAMTRLVAEAGVAIARSPMLGSDFLVSGLGTSAIGESGMVALAYTYVWHADIRTFVMASCANGLKLAESTLINRRPLFWAIALAILVSLGGSIWVVMDLAHAHGGINLNTWWFVGAPQAPFDYIAPKMGTVVPPSVEGWVFTGIGGAAMASLMLARQYLLWWPLHPIGFMISSLGWITGYIWFSVFLAWLVKGVILRYGGPGVFRATRTFFMGLIVGGAVAQGVWLTIDAWAR